MAESPDPSVISVEESKQLRAGSGQYRAYVGPPAQYDFMGATQFRLLTGLGMREEHHVLDIGCGSLRAGKLLIPYLLPDRYHGIEPNGWLIDEAIQTEIGNDLIRLKRPRFSSTSGFNYSEFGQPFDFIVAQSILSHTGHDLAKQAIAALPAVMHEHSLALVTFLQESSADPEVVRNGWFYPECVYYSERTINSFVESAGLAMQRLRWFHPRQTWYLIARSRGGLLSEDEIAALGSGAVLRDSRFS